MLANQSTEKVCDVHKSQSTDNDTGDNLTVAELVHDNGRICIG